MNNSIPSLYGLVTREVANSSEIPEGSIPKNLVGDIKVIIEAGITADVTVNFEEWRVIKLKSSDALESIRDKIPSVTDIMGRLPPLAVKIVKDSRNFGINTQMLIDNPKTATLADANVKQGDVLHITFRTPGFKKINGLVVSPHGTVVWP